MDSISLVQLASSLRIFTCVVPQTRLFTILPQGVRHNFFPVEILSGEKNLILNFMLR
jgi:hypothetical protein